MKIINNKLSTVKSFFLKELAAFHKGKVASRSTFEDGYMALKLANACYKSLSLKKTIKL